MLDEATLLQRAAELSKRFASTLVRWQLIHGRQDLPWQTPDDPYRVWLSEIMLQQTQVATVLGYYERFLQRFPDVAALAAAPLDDVLAAWAGLGYYSRARNLHRCAQMLVAQHGGQFPQSAEALERLPGIGPSTAAAIAAFCFQERAAILDGNVKRVLSRVLGYGADLADKRCERSLWQAARLLLPQDGAALPPYTQGLMDLGASLCAPRRPACAACPVQTDCAGCRSGTPQALPIKSRRLARKRRENWWLWLECEDHIWLEQRPTKGVWAGLWVLPMFADKQGLLQALRGDLQAAWCAGASTGQDWLEGIEHLPTVEHALTHFDWTLHTLRLQPQAHPARACADAGSKSSTGHWVPRSRLSGYALPAPLRKLLG